MTFRETKLPGVFEIELELKPDDRGFFARTRCRQEFESRGLNSKLAHCSVSFSAEKETLRGLHYHDATIRRSQTCALYSGVDL
jgi:dTDP-4-dehydrorhamnose 3,5-epimerase